MNWWSDHSNLALLAQYLLDNGDSAENIVYAIGKPWKYTDEFNAAVAERAADFGIPATAATAAPPAPAAPTPAPVIPARSHIAAEAARLAAAADRQGGDRP